MSQILDQRITLHTLLYPISLMALTLLLLTSYQTLQIMRDRDNLNVAKGQQEKAFVEGQKLQNQLSALLLGTQKLADDGNKNAKVITTKLKNMGIQIRSPEAKSAANDVSMAPVPVAKEKPEPGPVKP